MRSFRLPFELEAAIAPATVLPEGPVNVSVVKSTSTNGTLPGMTSVFDPQSDETPPPPSSQIWLKMVVSVAFAFVRKSYALCPLAVKSYWIVMKCWESERSSTANRNGTTLPSAYVELLPLRSPFCQEATFEAVPLAH